MCDQIPADECPECSYVLPDEYDYDDGYELINDDLWYAAKEGPL
ncbi:hypothetical protein [Agrococcus sp. DT81.2]